MPRKNLQDYTSIHVTKTFTRDLHRLGEHGESYEQIMRRIMDFYTNHHVGHKRKQKA